MECRTFYLFVRKIKSCPKLMLSIDKANERNMRENSSLTEVLRLEESSVWANIIWEWLLFGFHIMK